MADFNIPDGPEGETYEQEVHRVGDCIPDNLKGLWLGLLGAPEEQERGWPEMVATYLQLTPPMVVKCLAAMSMIHLVRLNGSMMKIENTGAGNTSKLVVAFARDDAAKFLGDGYRIGKMQAVLSSSQLAGSPLMLPYVERMTSLLEEADAAVAALDDAASDAGDLEVRNLLKARANRLGERATAVRELLERTPSTPPAKDPPPSNADVFGRPGNDQ